jgi:hypothetical protein
LSSTASRSRLDELRRELTHQARSLLRRFGSSLTPRASADSRFRQSYFAEQSVDLRRMKEYRQELFPAAGPLPWLDRPDAEEEIARKVGRGELTPEQAANCREWRRDGYVVLPGLLSAEYLDGVWAAYERGIAQGTVVLQPEQKIEGDPLPPRSLDPHLRVTELDGLLRHPRMLEWSNRLLGRESIAFQTLLSHKGSQQKPHSDSIHMTTYPPGYLTAAWVAFEDIHADCGPVEYYPGSHRLPFLSSQALGISTADFRRRGYETYFERYEPAIAGLIEKEKLRPVPFLARKGDVLFWHANLIHAGSVRKNLAVSRKAAVCHYFARGAVCYHDLAGTLADPGRVGGDH